MEEKGEKEVEEEHLVLYIKKAVIARIFKRRHFLKGGPSFKIYIKGGVLPIY